MKQVLITDAVTITSLGNDLEQLWQGLMSGKTGIKTVRHFPVENYTSKYAACIEDLVLLGTRNKNSRIRALLDRLLANMFPVPADSFLITATTKSGIDNLEQLCRENRTDTQDILLSTILDIVSQKLKLTAKGTNINAACASSTIAIAHGAARIASGKVNSVLVCCIDIITEFIFSGFSSLKALSSFPCRPFSRTRCGLTPGEGAAAILLMSEDRAKKENLRSLGRVVGWGVSNDATHITAPAQDASGLTRAVGQALKRANLKKQDIGAISAHGTGTVYNDLMELNAFRQIFGEHQVPVYSVKGSIGHTMGAAGGIEVALGLKALSTGVVPPTVGFSDPEDGTKGLLSSKPKVISTDFLLTTNSGFGGINAAIILAKGESK
ncbi:MAG: beta-ketoacyl-[acyl-carrier-protein] synthase family protein [Thermodesulfobacteriota bacterium]|nr:beta-ketoacyl-[acyl-carrier-protein] synthase family protein [Thermodesulfobacteriota bacterium]